MPTLDRQLRRRPRRLARHRTGLGTENLEARRLLAATPINVASGLTIASGLPLPGLATGSGFATTAQSSATAAVTVAPSSVGSPVVPSATGPSTTLSPLMSDSETAVATASEAARPTPGRSDRISVILKAPEVAVVTHLQTPDPIEVIPGPEIQGRPPVVPAPAQPTVEPPAPLRQVDPDPAPIPKAVPEAPKEPIAFQVWDAALDSLSAEISKDTSASLTHRTEAALAAGAMLAAWTGWKHGPRSQGRSRRRPVAIAVVEGGEAGGTTR